MAYKKALIAEKLLQWEKNLREYSLPKWEELPSFELYMDQVVSLLRGSLDFLPEEIGKHTQNNTEKRGVDKSAHSLSSPFFISFTVRCTDQTTAA